MKILFVTDQRYRSSGVSVFCVELCEALIDIGVDVKLALQRPKFKDPYPVRHVEMLTTITEILRAQDEFDWDIVHINGVWNWPYHKVARIAHAKGVPVVWSSHGSLNPWAFRHKWYKKLLAWFLYQKCDLLKANLLHVTAPSEKKYLRELGLMNNIIVQPLGVRLRWSDTQLEQFLRKTQEKKILFIGRLHPVKGIDNLIRAWAKIMDEDGKEEISNWKVEIIGDEAISGYGETLLRLCRDLGVDKYFVFKRALFGDEKEMAYVSAKALVLPSHSENFGSVIVEALSNGIPVITTTGTPWHRIAEHSCGWWVGVGVEPLALALREVMRMGDESLSKMGMRGRKWMRQDFAWGSIAKNMKSVYEWVCGRGAIPRWVEEESSNE